MCSNFCYCYCLYNVLYCHGLLRLKLCFAERTGIEVRYLHFHHLVFADDRGDFNLKHK